MTTTLHDPAGELDGRAVRRLTRASAAQRAGTTWRERLSDAWTVLATGAIGLAMLGSWLASVRDEIAARPPASSAPLPASVTVLAALVVAVAALAGLLDRLGPVSATPAATAWWLPLPADRRGLLRGDLLRIGALCALPPAAVVALLRAVSGSGSSPAAVASAGILAAATAVGLVGAVALLQTRGRTGRLSAGAGAVAVAAAGVVAVAAAYPPLARAARRLAPAELPAVPLPAALAALVAALALLATAERGLGRIGAASLRPLGATSAYASASVFSLDTRDLGRALAGRPRRPARTRRFRRVRTPWQAVVTADLALLTRSSWQAGQLLVAVALPVLAFRTEGLDRLAGAGAAGLLLGWLAAAVAVGHPSRQARSAPAIDRLLPLSPGGLVAARCVVPAAVLTVVCACGGLLAGAGRGDLAIWLALALGTVPTWTAAALRGAYRPDPDWSGPAVSTPMGVLPAGASATLVQGVDVGLAGALPVTIALLLDDPPLAALAAGQWIWAGGLAAAALTAVARREPG